MVYNAVAYRTLSSSIYVRLGRSTGFCFFSVSAGEDIMVPLMALNRLEEIWGSDASEYKWVVLLKSRIQRMY